MKYNELKNQIEEIKTKTIKICQQTNIMFIPLTNKIVKENGTEEVKVQYGIDHVINEFLYKENKTLFLIEQLLKCYMQILKNQSEILRYFENSVVYIDGYNNFTNIEYKFIEFLVNWYKKTLSKVFENFTKCFFILFF